VTAKTTLTIRIIRMLGPGSACRASVGVSTIRPCFFSAIEVFLSDLLLTPTATKCIGSRCRGTERSRKSCPGRMEDFMAKKFNPAPADKHAADTKQAQKADEDMHEMRVGMSPLERLGT
jgi:hypothetical protein